MRLLLDNTLVHQVGRVLDSPIESAIRNVDALGLFHLAEHILFAEDVIVSNFEANSTFERTASILAILEEAGLIGRESGSSFFRLEAFTELEYRAACEATGWRVLDELMGLTARGLTTLGKFADEAVRPEGIAPPPLDSWLSDPHFLAASPGRIASLASLKATASVELTILSCPPLFTALKSVRAKTKHGRERQAAAVAAITRVCLNQELAKLRSAVYAPAPQRARMSHVVDSLFRHKLERKIEQEVLRTSRGDLERVSSWFRGSALLPLPLFALHALRGKPLGSPRAILEAARLMRDDSEIKGVRHWLGKLEDQEASSRGKIRSTAFGELNRLAEEIASHLSGRKFPVFADLLNGGSFTVAPHSGEWEYSPPMVEFLELLSRRYRRQRRFLAAIAEELATDEQLGGAILQQLGRSLKP